MPRSIRSKRNDRGRDTLNYRTLGDEAAVGGNGGGGVAPTPPPPSTVFLQTDMSKTTSEWFFLA